MVSGAPQPYVQIKQMYSSQEFESAIRPGKSCEHDTQAKESGARPDDRADRNAQCRVGAGAAGMAYRRLGDGKDVRTRADHGQHMDSEDATEHNSVVHTM